VVSPEDLEAIARMLLERARGGDLAAVKLLYVIGRPVEAADPDRLDVQEWQLFQQMQASAEQVQAALGGLALELACTTVRAARGPIADATAAQLAQALRQAPAAPPAVADSATMPAVTGRQAQENFRDGPKDRAASDRPRPAQPPRPGPVPGRRRHPGAADRPTDAGRSAAVAEQDRRRHAAEEPALADPDPAWEAILAECAALLSPRAAPHTAPSEGVA
jgi:hypothetical protein